MKKFILMLAAALPMVFTSCGDDNDDLLTLDESNITLDYGKDHTLKASEKNCVWTSSDTFVATVDQNGKIEAQHVGTAVITATKDGNVARCNVIVNATNNNFIMPIVSFGLNPADLKTAVNAQNIAGLALVRETEANLAYFVNGSYPIYAYSFVDNKLTTSSLTVTPKMDEDQDLEEFLDQRYAYLGETDNGYLYGNAETLAASTVNIAYEYYPDDDEVYVVWTTPKSSKGGVTYNAAAAKANREFVRSLTQK